MKGCENMFLLVSLSKSKFSLVSHSCHSCSTRVVLVSLVFHSRSTRVTRAAPVSLASGIRVVK